METQNTTTSNGGTEFHRVFLSDVFGDYIPSFHYLVVPLNKYSKQDLIEKNDELSLIFLINQLQNSSEFHALKDIPKEYTEHLTENTYLKQRSGICLQLHIPLPRFIFFFQFSLSFCSYVLYSHKR